MSKHKSGGVDTVAIVHIEAKPARERGSVSYLFTRKEVAPGVYISLAFVHKIDVQAIKSLKRGCNCNGRPKIHVYREATQEEETAWRAVR